MEATHRMKTLLHQNRITPQDWNDLATAILKAGHHLQWKKLWIEEPTVIEQ